MDDEYTLLKEAASYLKQKRIVEAAQLYQKIGEFFAQKSFYQKALAAYQKSLALHPNPNLYFSLAGIYEKIQRNFSAYEALKQAYHSFIRQKAFEKSLEAGFKMSHLQPDAAVPHEKIAEVYFYMGHTPEASAEYQNAAVKAEAQGDFRKSMEYLFYAFKMAPKDKEIWKKLRHALIQRRGAEDAQVQKLDEILKIKPEAPEKLIPKKELWPPEKIAEQLKNAQTLMEEYLFDEAKKIVEEILVQHPQHPEALKALETLTAEQMAALGEATEPSTEELIRSLEEDLDIKEAPTAPGAAVKVATPSHALSAQTLYELAIAYKEMNLYREAADLAKKALRKIQKKEKKSNQPTPFELDCILLMGICYRHQKAHFDAISLLEKTLSAQGLPLPYRLALLYQLALALESGGNFNKALYFLRKIEKEDKQYRDIRERIHTLRKKRHV